MQVMLTFVALETNTPAVIIHDHGPESGSSSREFLGKKNDMRQGASSENLNHQEAGSSGSSSSSNSSELRSASESDTPSTSVIVTDAHGNDADARYIPGDSSTSDTDSDSDNIDGSSSISSSSSSTSSSIDTDTDSTTASTHKFNAKLSTEDAKADDYLKTASGPAVATLTLAKNKKPVVHRSFTRMDLRTQLEPNESKLAIKEPFFSELIKALEPMRA
jgi:hypothetical protein